MKWNEEEMEGRRRRKEEEGRVKKLTRGVGQIDGLNEKGAKIQIVASEGAIAILPDTVDIS